MIAVIDYGGGNVKSVVNMLKKIGTEATLTSDVSIIESAKKLILPGVGAFDFGMSQLRDLGLISVLQRRVIDAGVPILGICLGMQLLAEASEEGVLPGLGWIKGRLKKFKFQDEAAKLPVPHMGWSEVTAMKQSKLADDLPEQSRFYFVHSYHLSQSDQKELLLQSNYGFDFPAACERENILGVQFHPEKSHRYGMKLLQNFVEHY